MSDGQPNHPQSWSGQLRQRFMTRDVRISKIVILASLLITLSAFLIGWAGYFLTERSMVAKLKAEDLPEMIAGVAAEVDGRIERAKESSLVLAHDPVLLAWLKRGETDAQLAEQLFAKLSFMRHELDYSMLFIASTGTRQYWVDNGQAIGTLAEDRIEDDWFFDHLSKQEELHVHFDYNKDLDNMFAFVNVRVGSRDEPLAVTGVGVSLADLSEQFAAFTHQRHIRIWLVDAAGSVVLSDRPEDHQRLLGSLLPADLPDFLLKGGHADLDQTHGLLSYTGDDGQSYDLVQRALRSADLMLVMQIDRQETMQFLQALKWNSILIVFISVIIMVVFFIYMTRKLTHPFKRAVIHNRVLERRVERRNTELLRRNEEMTDSLNYAKRLQQSVLPDEQELSVCVPQHFLIWQPRELVGGDFYWTRCEGGSRMIAIGDCTGHGVPGAFMTMLAISALNQAAEGYEGGQPGMILAEVNRLLRQRLRQEDEDGLTDDGLDLGLIVWHPQQGMQYAGAGLHLYHVLPDRSLRQWKGDRRGIGYRRTADTHKFDSHVISDSQHGVFYLTTDGYLDQNGGLKDYSFGRKRFEAMLQGLSDYPFDQQRRRIQQALADYQGRAAQRDDITVLAFTQAKHVEQRPGTGKEAEDEDRTSTQPIV